MRGCPADCARVPFRPEQRDAAVLQTHPSSHAKHQAQLPEEVPEVLERLLLSEGARDRQVGACTDNLETDLRPGGQAGPALPSPAGLRAAVVNQPWHGWEGSGRRRVLRLSQGRHALRFRQRRSPGGCLFFTLQTSYLFKQVHIFAVVQIYHKAFIICLCGSVAFYHE